MTRLPSLRRTSSTRQAALEHAIDALAHATGIRFEIIEPAVGARAEAVLELDGETYDARIRMWVQHAPLTATIEQIKRHPTGILIADYVSPERADRFRDAGVPFLDTAGNAFLKTPRCYVFIKGHPRPRPVPGFGKPLHHPAYTTNGAKVTFALLCQPVLAGATDAEIANIAGVSLGTVTNVFDDLAETDHVERSRGQRLLVRREDLLDAWVEHYPETLRPTLSLGLYQTENTGWWKTFDINRYGGCWGGEIAGAVYTKHGEPAEAIVYAPKAMQMQLIATAHLRKIPRPVGGAGTVALLAPFWRHHYGPPGLVHPLLAYADLIASDQPRNILTARKLYQQHLRPLVEPPAAG
jgi:hypothetical protein